jgi:prepilin-type N-terminal cleavage/methylation domain-containing protein
MNKKGYTLIELLATIIILSILTSIIVVNVSSYLKKTDETSFNTLVKSVETATELYVADHSTEYLQLDVVGSTFEIELNDLVNDDYINSNIIDERTGETIPLTTKIRITVISIDKIDVDFLYE